MDNCIFCKIVKGEIPAYKVYEDESYIAILDINPAAYGHTLVIPKAHFADVYEVDEEYGAKLLPVLKKAAEAVKEVTGAQGVNILQNNGAVAGQTVMHYHAHIIPRVAGDGLNFSWIPKNPSKQFMAEMTEKLAAKINE